MALNEFIKQIWHFWNHDQTESGGAPLFTQQNQEYRQKSKPCWQTSYQYYLHYEDAHPNGTKDMLIPIEPGHNSLITSLKWGKMKTEIRRSHFPSWAFPLFSSFLPTPPYALTQAKRDLPFSTLTQWSSDHSLGSFLYNIGLGQCCLPALGTNPWSRSHHSISSMAKVKD